MDENETDENVHEIIHTSSGLTKTENICMSAMGSSTYTQKTTSVALRKEKNEK